MNINEIINKEINLGYHDGAIFGGFGAFISAWAKSHGLQECQQLAEKYSAASLQERPLIIEQLAASIPAEVKSIPCLLYTSLKAHHKSD